MLALLHCSFMENIFLVKIQRNVNKRKHIHNNFLSEVSHTIKIQNFELKFMWKESETKLLQLFLKNLPDVFEHFRMFGLHT